MTPTELLTAARVILERPAAATSGLWPRASALLARQALEEALRTHWATSTGAESLGRCSMRSQLICLPSYLDVEVAGQAAHVWAALSGACHYHPYELAPTAGELTSWFGAVEDLLVLIGASPSSTD